jgi:hypothetical protein
LKKSVVCPLLSEEQRGAEGDSFAESIAGSTTERSVRIGRHCRSTICALLSINRDKLATSIKVKVHRDK